MWRLTLKTLVFDLDDTICYPNHDAKDTYHKYVLARPNIEMIESMKRAKSKGYCIDIYTARRMLTHDGNIESILKDIADITIKWLQNHNVPYDKVYFGKPYAEYYIDDKALRPDEFIGMMNE